VYGTGYTVFGHIGEYMPYLGIWERIYSIYVYGRGYAVSGHMVKTTVPRDVEKTSIQYRVMQYRNGE